MKCAVLCNGPSRIAYTPNKEYEFVLGCNVPWTKVDATVVLDKQLIEVWNKNRPLINVPVYFSTQAWASASQLDKDFFEQYFAGTLITDPQYHSSGHNAVEVVIKKGFTHIDIYGCDAYFDTTKFDSYTRSVISMSSPNYELRNAQRMVGWKIRWKQMIENHPTVKLNFIRK